MLKTAKKKGQKVLSVLLSLVMSLGVLLTPSVFFPEVSAAHVDIGANPTPVVDIAVNVPSDYPGTFLDFKEELTQKLLEAGMEPGSFRITDTAAKIDTTDLNGWYVYDHYYSQAEYDALNLSDEQKAKQPFRAADNSHTTGGIVTMESLLAGGNISGCRNFKQHIWSYTNDEGKANMVFAGYGTNPLMDYMIYPATSDARRTISFDLDASAIGAHTLQGYGFWLNAGIENGKLTGYVLYLGPGHSGGIQKVTDLDVNSNALTVSNGVQAVSLNVGAQKKARITVELRKDKVSIQQQQYDANGNLSAVQDVVKDVPLDNTGFNGFGPVVGYASHGCAELTVFRYLDLEMKYESTAFDALKTTQYYQGAEQKYFINLAGDSNDPQIPDETDPTYKDGINRMNENEIFYISNADDGKILKDTEKDEAGNTTHTGLGSSNGFIANGDNYTDLIAQYIYTNHIEGVKFQQGPIDSELPLANFYMRDLAGNQLMTIHLQHLVKAWEYNQSNGDEPDVQDYVDVNIVDRSKPGTLAGEDGKIAQWRFRVYDPKNSMVYDSNWLTSVDDIDNYRFTKDSASGRWTFELLVKDQLGNESKTSQTYMVAFLDDEVPEIEGANTAKNKATITLTDTGMGIDDDGITFIEDGRGSGVASYWVTNDLDAEPTEGDWIVLDAVSHSYSFDLDVVDTSPIVVHVRDECGNQGYKAVFQPTHVIVKDPEGNEIDDYYVIGDKPIIVLPNEDDIPNKPDPDDGNFSGWVTEGEDPITPGTSPDTDGDHTIVIKPEYTKDKVQLIYLANGGKFADDTDTLQEEAVSKCSILAKVNAFDQVPTQKGYSFAGWKLLTGTDISDLTKTEEITTQLATCVKDDEGNITRDKYYLVAQWEIGKYKVHFDPNGGSAGLTKTIDDVSYGTKVSSLAVPVSGRGIPSKPGYIFMGWSTTKNDADNYENAFIAAQGQTISNLIDAPTLEDSDLTVYALWQKDTRSFIVSFDSQGGSKINDQAYMTATATAYDTFMRPSKAGYTFEGWYYEDGDTEYVGGEAFIVKADHTFTARWKAVDNTKYTVDYFVNSGNLDAKGNYIYTKVTDEGVTKTYTAATESEVSIPESDKLETLTTGGKTYWFNEDNPNNKLTGTVTGSPALSLRLYYDRYFDVTATKQGDGTVTGAVNQKEGSMPTVSWEAAAIHGLHIIILPPGCHPLLSAGPVL